MMQEAMPQQMNIDYHLNPDKRVGIKRKGLPMNNVEAGIRLD